MCYSAYTRHRTDVNNAVRIMVPKDYDLWFLIQEFYITITRLWQCRHTRTVYEMSRDSWVSVMTGLGAERPGLESRKDKIFFSLSQRQDWILYQSSCLSSGYGGSFLQGKAVGADNPSPSAEVKKNTWSYTSITLYVCVAWCLKNAWSYRPYLDSPLRPYNVVLN
jgi:hypothetical protein